MRSARGREWAFALAQNEDNSRLDTVDHLGGLFLAKLRAIDCRYAVRAPLKAHRGTTVRMRDWPESRGSFEG